MQAVWVSWPVIISKVTYDLDLPVVAIGILWWQDYTKQLIGPDGYPYDTYPVHDFSFLEDTGKRVTVQISGEDVECRISGQINSIIKTFICCIQVNQD